MLLVNSGQAERYLARKGATFGPGEGGHLLVTLNGRRTVLPQHGGSKEIGKGFGSPFSSNSTSRNVDALRSQSRTRRQRDLARNGPRHSCGRHLRRR
jgi:mRNA interferase HicA